MQAKKKLIFRLAAWAAALMVVAGTVVVVGLLQEDEAREAFNEEREQARRQRIETSRAYLAEVAKRVRKLPVDAALVGEIESRYFEEQANGPFFLWAMDTRGEFVFGVPGSAFSKVNAVYDREVTPRLKEGVLLDRQTFLMSLVDESDSIAPELAGSDDEKTDAVELVKRGRGFRLGYDANDHDFVLSTPIKADDGAALGNLYLKRKPEPGQRYYHGDNPREVIVGVAGVITVASLVFLWLLLPTWVYVDARERGVRRAPLFAFLTVISSIVGLLVYLIARPEEARRLNCPGCAREVNGGAFCPHCGRDLSASFCPACRYPLKTDWAFCPACRTELKPSAPAAPVPEAG